LSNKTSEKGILGFLPPVLFIGVKLDFDLIDFFLYFHHADLQVLNPFFVVCGQTKKRITRQQSDADDKKGLQCIVFFLVHFFKIMIIALF
jgi:hypothetical protein